MTNIALTVRKVGKYQFDQGILLEGDDDDVVRDLIAAREGIACSSLM
jgi:hypothetical protein